jgi:hypothetical protein
MAGREHDGLTDLARDPLGTGTERGSWVICALEGCDPGAAFPGVIGLTTDESGLAWPTGRRCLRQVPGAGARWMRGYGRWVRVILVWTKAPFLFPE